MNNAALSVEHVSKLFRIPLDHSTTLKYRVAHPLRTSRYRTLKAVNDVSFDVGRGEFLGIAGPNGCGKSTLLKMLSRIYPPTWGRITVRGRVSPFLELGVGFNPELTARENIYLGGAVLGLTRRQLSRRVDSVLDFAELGDFADQKLRNFSTGMGVRLAFSVAIQADARILLMDEVLAVGDAAFQEKCFEVFAQYKRENRTVVLVSHDLQAIEHYCDRALLLTGGSLVASGAPSPVVAEYRHMVDAALEDRAHVGEPVDLERGTRWGTGEVEITSVRVADPDGRERRSFATGEPLMVTVEYHIDRPVGDFYVCLVLRGDDGTNLASPRTRVFASELGDSAQGTRSSVSYHVPSVGVLAGRYALTVSACDVHRVHEYDHLEDLLRFRVTDDEGRSGILDLGGEWAGRFLRGPAEDRRAAS